MVSQQAEAEAKSLYLCLTCLLIIRRNALTENLTSIRRRN